MSHSEAAQIVVTSDSSSFKRIRDFVRKRAADAGFNRTDTGRLVLAVDEVCSNIIKHSYHFEPHHRIVLSWHDREDAVVLEIEDDSPIPYLPSPADFDLPTKIKYRHANGYGKYLIRKVLDDVQYETIPGSHNKVSLIKFREGQGPTRQKESLLNPYDLARTRALSLLTLFDIGDNLSRQKKLDSLLKIFFYAVMGRLTTQPVVLLAPLSTASPFCVAGEMGLSKRLAVKEMALPRHGWVVETLWSQHGPFLVDELRRLKIPAEEMETLQKLDAALLIPLFIMNQLCGVLSLGPKRSGRAFSEEDVNFVTFLGTHMLLLMGHAEQRAGATGGVPAKPGGEIRSATRAAVVHLARTAEECHITLDLEKGPATPSSTIEAEVLHKVVLSLLTHILYLSEESGAIAMKVESQGKESILSVAYVGTPLAFEKGKPGYNQLIDQMMSGGFHLKECRKVIESAGGRIQVAVQGMNVALTLTVPQAS